MNCDPRGGHNRLKVDKNFFKSWSPQMAYLLGFIYADGTVEDFRKSSRTCYLAVTSIDLSLIKQIKYLLNSGHKIQIRPAGKIFFGDKIYFRQKAYGLRIGSKAIYEDLLKLGLTPRKSLTIKLPSIPRIYFSHFLRGYFDGDGCVSVYLLKERPKASIQVIFTSGSKDFLDAISNTLTQILGIKIKTIFKGGRAFRLSYKKNDSLKILNYIYKDIPNIPFLARKYKIYKDYLKTLST
jgi:intein-encoded DNA endonuclease-like protein